MKAAVIIFHKNVDEYIPREWVNKCIDSIRAQTYKDFDVFELNYGGNKQVYPGSIFIRKEFNNHAEAHNYLLDGAFSEGYDCAFNVNIDDYYASNRLEVQLKYIEQGYDVVSSNFYRFWPDGTVLPLKFDHLNPALEARCGHNIIAHPVCCYSRNYWLNCGGLNPAEIPQDDFELWKRSYARGFKFVIAPEFLLWHRVHDNNVSKK